MGNMTTLQILQGVHDWVLDKIDEETANFITKTVNDLVNYYTKSETYTKAEVQQIVDAIKQFTYEVVQVLPTASASTMNKIYLVHAPKSEDKNVKEEYITIQDGSTYSWEMLGTTSIDLSNYYTKGQTDSAITAALNSALANYTTTEALTALLAAKQDVIQDLTNIRDGAAAGATAVQPNGLAAALVHTVAEAGVFDLSKHNAVEGQLATYADLNAALTALDALHAQYKYGGMSFKFVTTSDNSYHRYNLTANTFSTDPADWEEDASIEQLEGGDIIPKLAQNLESWEGREDLTVNTSWSEPVRTTAGDASIVSSKGGKIVSIVPRSDFYASALKSTGFNLLRNAVQIGSTTKYYFLVPKLIFGTFGTADEPNGVLFTNAQDEKMTPTVYFKKLSDGVPTSTSYGSACAYTTNNGYRFYTCSEVGYMVVDGVTLASTCAHIAWSRRYDDYVAVNAAGDAGASVSLAAIFTALHAANQPALYINADVRDFIEFTATTAVWHRLCDKVTVSTWTNTEVPSETGGESTYIHSATISGMKSGGVARIGSMMLSVEGTTVSFTDSNATAEAADVVYELSTQASGTVSVTPTYSVEDWGLEYLDGTTGTAEVTTQYCRNYPDSLAALAQFDFRDLSQVVGEALAELYAELQGIKQAMNRNAITFDEYGNPLRMGQRMFALTSGVPTEIPKSIGLFRMDSSTGHVWVSKGLTISTNDWKQIQ